MTKRKKKKSGTTGCDVRCSTTEQVANEGVHCTCQQIINAGEMMNWVTHISLFPAIHSYPTLAEEFQITLSTYLPVTHLRLEMCI